MREWLNARTEQRICVVNAHRQYGKSTAMFQFADEYARKNPNSIIKIGGPFQTQIKDIISIVVNTVLHHCPRDLRPKYSQGRFIYSNGSVIMLIGVDRNMNALRGTPSDLVILDEVGFMSDLDGLVKSVILPTFNQRPHGRLIMISTPPDVLVHDFTATYIPLAKSKDAYWELPITANPQFVTSQIDKFAADYDIVGPDGKVITPGRESDKFKREYMCEIVPDMQRLIFPEWQDLKINETEHHLVLEDIKPPEYYKPIVVADWGFKDHTGIVYGWVDWENASLIVKQETFVNYKTAFDISKMIKEKVPEVFPGMDYEKIIFYVDADESHQGQIRKYTGMNWLSANGWVKNNKEGNINGIRELIGKSRLYVDAQCKNLITQLDGGVWDKQRRDWERSDVMGHCDMLAALIYMNKVAKWKENPIPARTPSGDPNEFVSPRYNYREAQKNNTWSNAFGGKK